MADAAGRLLAVDPQVCEIMHREERELIGMSFETLTHVDDRARNISALASLAIADGPMTIRKRYVRPDGSSVWSHVQVSRLKATDGNRLIGTIELVGPDIARRGPESLWRSAKCINALIQRRRQELGDDLFSDYAWLILLQIYLAEAEGRTITVREAAARADIRDGVAERWIAVFRQRRLIDCSEWTDHAPQLTAHGMRQVERLLDWNVDY
ncbi:PAS domain-containing protein [Sphingomonas sp. A2-49]|uniref:PAS domain-containing protein n=1 Tax=Sphingomonas sp. A2-49 TaxID=1391375 RepID=UPI0021CE1C39|nr:PAS domain-containing protein [Sphingomonas sp. A2-49]MCU6454528.1 PAS domain-containing protein [Sphingomonas sp. A2-49]